MITQTQMEHLLDIKDAVEELEGVLGTLTGSSLVLGYSDGTIGKLTRVYGLVRELSNIKEPEPTVEDDALDYPLEKLIGDKSIDNKEKARQLLNGNGTWQKNKLVPAAEVLAELRNALAECGGVSSLVYDRMEEYLR